MAKLIANKQQDSQDWFIGKARTAAGYRKKIINNAERSRDNVIIGKMFFFSYDPKYKDTLPMYDRFPLVFPIEPYSNGFLGLNLHYLVPAERRWLLSNLAKFADKRYSTPTRLKLTYDLLSTTKKLSRVTRPCIKRYLFTHVRSRFIEIEGAEWEKAIDLPVAMFEYN
jgi:hypothetical protein